jgi:hypothetical protein
MPIITGYHTLGNRGNAIEIEMDGPIKAKKIEIAWLGEGYYFWDSDLEWAHFWGNKNYSAGYYIFCGEIKLGNDCFDLVGSAQLKIEFRKIIEELKSTGYFAPGEVFTVADVIEYLKKYTVFLQKYTAIRVTHIPKSLITIPFGGNRAEFMYVNEPIQICLINLNNLDLETFKLIHE